MRSPSAGRSPPPPPPPPAGLSRAASGVARLGACALLVAGDRAGAEVRGLGGAFAVVAVVAMLNAVLPPLVAALRLPFTVALGFLLVLALDAAMLLLAADIAPDELDVDGLRGRAGSLARRRGASSTRIGAIVGIDDDDTYTLRVARRVARRAPAGRWPRMRPGSCSSRSTGSRCRCCAGRCGTATRPTWRAGSRSGSHALDRMGDGPLLADRRQPGRASCSGTTTTSRPSAGSTRPPGASSRARTPTTARRSSGALARRRGCSSDGGTSRGNLLSGEADEAILTVSRLADEKSREPRLSRVPRQRLERHAHARARALGDLPRARSPPRASAGATCARAATAAACIRCCAPGCACSSATSSSSPSFRTCSAACRRSTRRSPATTRSLTTPASSAPTRSRRCASSTSASA